MSDDEILETARAVFLELGPGAPMTAVASRVGLSQPALSQRFGSKRQLLVRALSPRGLGRFVERLEAGPGSGDVRPQLRAVAVGAAQVLLDAVPAMLVLRVAGFGALRDGPSPGSLPHERVRDALVAYLERAQAAGQLRDGPAEQMATMLIGSVQAWVLHAYVSGATIELGLVRAHAQGVVDMMLDGIGPKEVG